MFYDYLLEASLNPSDTSHKLNIVPFEQSGCHYFRVKHVRGKGTNLGEIKVNIDSYPSYNEVYNDKKNTMTDKDAKTLATAAGIYLIPIERKYYDKPESEMEDDMQAAVNHMISLVMTKNKTNYSKREDEFKKVVQAATDLYQGKEPDWDEDTDGKLIPEEIEKYL